MRTTKLVRSGLTLLLCSPLFGGCLITTNSDDDSNTAASDTDSESTYSQFTDSSSSSSEGAVDESSGSVGETTVGPMGDCSDSRIVDGGFEAGTPSMVWTEMSEQFGTPICDVGCTDDEGAVPYAGDWFAWFGGVSDPENASVAQTVTLDGEAAYLAFRFEINAAAGLGDDVFTVSIDDNVVFMASDAEIDDFASYTPVSIDVSEYVDGGDHVVKFASHHPGTGLSNFFLDEISLVTCTEGGGSSSSGGSETTAADGSTSAGSSDSGSGSSGTDSGSSGSDSGSSSTTM